MPVVKKGNNAANKFVGESFAETFDGMGNYDTVNYFNSLSSLSISLTAPRTNTGDAAGDTYISIESFELGRGNDTFIGDGNRQIVNGYKGNDTISGGGGLDILMGEAGNDVLAGGAGIDQMWGGSGADTMSGGSGNDYIQGDSANDVITGGADDGSITLSAIKTQYYQYSSTILIALSLIDDYGEWVEVPKRHAVENAGALTSINRADGDAIFVVTNGYDDARNWNATTITGLSPRPPIDLGPGGEIGADTSIIFNAGPGNTTAYFSGSPEAGYPGPKAAGNNPNGVITVTTYNVGSITPGDVLKGGIDADRFVFNIGDGVDKILDFTKGQDTLDVVDTWFDGNATNGEFLAKAHGAGSVIFFSDSSADGVIDGNAIWLPTLAVSAVDATIFV